MRTTSEPMQESLRPPADDRRSHDRLQFVLKTKGDRADIVALALGFQM